MVLQNIVSIATEDILSECLVCHLLTQERPDLTISPIRRSGFGYLKMKLPGLNETAHQLPVLMLTDLDQEHCVTALKQKWFGSLKPAPLLQFQVAIREVEAWLLADSVNLAKFLKVATSKIPTQPELVPDPKRELINLAKKSQTKTIRDGIPPERGSTAKIGPEYNDLLCKFVSESWDYQTAKAIAPSLSRFLRIIPLIGRPKRTNA